MPSVVASNVLALIFKKIAYSFVKIQTFTNHDKVKWKMSHDYLMIVRFLMKLYIRDASYKLVSAFHS